MINKLKTKDISAEELKRAKENLKGRMYLGLEESFAVAEFLAEQQLFWGKIEHPEEIISKYLSKLRKGLIIYSIKHPFFASRKIKDYLPLLKKFLGF